MFFFFKRLDREWYNDDDVIDEESNPFASVSEEYTKKKEQALEQKRRIRMSAQQRQINQVEREKDKPMKIHRFNFNFSSF